MSRYIDADKLLELYDYQELNEIINAYARKGVDKKKWNIPIGVVKQNIKDMPTADVRENVRGAWKFSHTNCYVCSICGHCIAIDDQAKNDWYRHNYCGHCGADNHWER